MNLPGADRGSDSNTFLAHPRAFCRCNTLCGRSIKWKNISYWLLQFRNWCETCMRGRKCFLAGLRPPINLERVVLLTTNASNTCLLVVVDCDCQANNETKHDKQHANRQLSDTTAVSQKKLRLFDSNATKICMIHLIQQRSSFGVNLVARTCQPKEVVPSVYFKMRT